MSFSVNDPGVIALVGESGVQLYTSQTTFVMAGPAVQLTGVGGSTIAVGAGQLTLNPGAGGKLAFFGAPPVVQQANASQAAISAISDPNAQACLQAIYNLLASYGLAPQTS